MAENLSPVIRVGEIPPKVRRIQGAATSTSVIVGIFEKGPIGVPTFVAGPEEGRAKFGGVIADGVGARELDLFFRNGGSRAYVLRVAHYTDIADKGTLTAIDAFKTIDDRLPNAGVKASGTIKVVNNAIEPWIAASAYAELTNNTFDVGDEVTVNGVSFVQGVDWIPGGTLALSAIALRDAVNASLAPAVDGIITAAIDGGNPNRVVFTAVTKGASGNTLTLAEVDAPTANITLSGALFTGGTDGDRLTVDNDIVRFADNVTIGANAAATAENIRAYLASVAAGVYVVSVPVATLDTVFVEFATVGTAGNAMVLSKIDPDNDLLLSGAGFLTGGLNTDTEEACDVIAADGPGIHANGRKIVISAARNALATHFKLEVKDSAGNTLDAFDNLNLIVGDPNYAENRINGKQQKLITFTDLLSSNTAGNNNLPALGTHTLAGGSDGLVGLNDLDFIGDLAARTGIFALEEIEERFAMAFMPDRTTVAAQLAFQQYADTKLSFKFFGDFPLGLSPQDAVDHKSDNGLTSEYCSLHFPALKVLDTLPANAGNEIVIPNSAAIAGIYARTDNQPGKGVAKLAAGVNDGRIFGAVGLESAYTQEKGNRDLIFPEGINPLWSEPGVGIINDGGYLTKTDGLVANVNERRVFLFCEVSIKQGIRFARHENIDEKLFNALNAAITLFLTQFWRQGGLKGKTASEAFFVNTDSGAGTINPPSEAEGFRVNVEVGLATKKPNYFTTVLFTVDQRALLEEISEG